MTKFLKFAGAVAMVVSLAAYAGAMTTLQQQQDQIAEGELVSIDVDTNVLTMKAADETEVQFNFTEETQVIGADTGIQGLTGQAGTRLRVSYQMVEDALTAIRIEVLP